MDSHSVGIFSKSSLHSEAAPERLCREGHGARCGPRTRSNGGRYFASPNMQTRTGGRTARRRGLPVAQRTEHSDAGHHDDRQEDVTSLRKF
jgi:hypothetical protein